MNKEAGDLYLNFINGSHKAFTALVKLLTPRFYRLFRHLGAEAGDAEDLCQEFFMAIYRAAGTFSQERDFMPWAYAIARNIYLKEAGRAGRVKIIPLFEWIASKNAHDENESENIDITRLLAKLSKEKREVFELKHFGGLKFDEIALILKIPAGTAKSRMFSAVFDLKEIISRSGI
jgi:RNA polymerase sigma-70 factor (ECF subfamily)